MESVLSGADSKAKGSYYGAQAPSFEGREGTSSEYKSFFKTVIPGGVIDVIPFPHKLKQTRSFGYESSERANLMMVYSNDCIWIYQICSELKNLNMGSKQQDPLKLDLLCCQRSPNSIISISFLNMEVAAEMETFFVILYEDCKVATVAFDYELGALETVALHDTKNKDSDKLLGASTAHHGAKPILKVQNIGELSGFAVVRDSCIISFHFSKRAGKQLAIDGKLLNNGVLVLQKE